MDRYEDLGHVRHHLCHMLVARASHEARVGTKDGTLLGLLRECHPDVPAEDTGGGRVKGWGW